MKDYYTQLKVKTDNIIRELDADFYFLKTSYNSLKIYEISNEIIELRGQSALEFKLVSDKDTNKSRILELLSNPTDFDEKTSAELAIKESFLLGMMCMALVHANVPLPKDMNSFGRVVNKQFSQK